MSGFYIRKCAISVITQHHDVIEIHKLLHSLTVTKGCYTKIAATVW